MPKKPLKTFHPLANCHWRTFLRLYGQNWPYPAKTLPARAVSWAAVLLQIPGNALEKRIYARRIAAHEMPEPPTFIVGHWRSGTTFLHNILTRSEQFTTISLAQAVRPLGAMRFEGVFQKILKAIVPTSRQIDSVAFSPSEPQEEELALALMGDVSIYHSLFFPRNALQNWSRALFVENLNPGELERFTANYQLLARKISLIDGGKRPLLFKNPANTTRLDFLRETFPGARFIHIVRRPKDVIHSSLDMLGTLTDWLSFQSRPKISTIDARVDQIIDRYALVMHAHLEQRTRIDPDRYAEVRYEDFKADPFETINGIYGSFGWKMEDRSRNSIRSYLDSLSGFKSNPRPDYPGLAEKVANRLEFAYRQWGYEP